MGQRTVVTHETETEMLRRRSDRASAALAVPHEVRDVGPVQSLHDAHAAIVRTRLHGAVRSERRPRVAGRRPLPDIAAEIIDAVCVGSVEAARLDRGIGRFAAASSLYRRSQVTAGLAGSSAAAEKASPAKRSPAAAAASSALGSRQGYPVFFEYQTANAVASR